MIVIKNFNLLVSTSRFNETNAKTELWFSLLMCGDKYPIITNLEFSGIISGLTVLEPKKVIRKIKNILDQDPNFFQYILKIIPIDFICETNPKVIINTVEHHYHEFIQPDDTFKIKIVRRKNDLIERDDFIRRVAEKISNKVNLDHPDVTIRFEILGNICGISFLRPIDFLKIINPYNQV
ncbi:MAG: THUMP domain-containing protein [Promethearchaeota archaeon]